MIQVKIYKNSSSFKKIEISGHSNKKKGESLPCAALSYLIQSISGFLFAKDIIIYKDDGYNYFIDLIKLKENSKDLYEFLIFSIQLIARDYPDDIKLEFLEENNGT